MIHKFIVIDFVEAIQKAYANVKDMALTAQYRYITVKFDRVDDAAVVETYSAIIRVTNEYAILLSSSEDHKMDDRIPIEDPNIVDKMMWWAKVPETVLWFNKYHSNHDCAHCSGGI